MSSSFESRRLTSFSQVKDLYRKRLKQDFARDERKPLSAMRRLWKDDAYDCYGLFDGDEILGYAFFVHLGKNYMVDYLAISEDRRGQGLGSIFLRQLGPCLADADCILCEIEDPDKAPDEATRLLRERRLQFYQRNGYRKTGLTSLLFGVDYRILEFTAAGSHTAAELRAIYTEFYRYSLSDRYMRTQFKLFEESESQAGDSSSFLRD